jgi:hypothetical protein
VRPDGTSGFTRLLDGEELEFEPLDALDDRARSPARARRGRSSARWSQAPVSQAGAACDPVGGRLLRQTVFRFILSCPDPLGLTKAIEPKLWVKGGGARFTRFSPE